MAITSDWKRVQSITIDNTKVTATQTNYPFLVTKEVIDDELFDADGTYPAKNGGGDIRFTSDSAGAVELAFDLVSFVTDNDPANGYCQIYVKVPSVSGSVDTTIYIWYNNVAASGYADTDTYGKYNAWTDFTIVTHLEESGDSTPDEYKNSASNTKHGTGESGNVPDQIAGHLGEGYGQLNISNDNDEIEFGDVIDISSTDFSFEMWVHPDAPPASSLAFVASKTNAYSANNMEFEWGWSQYLTGIEFHWWGATQFVANTSNTYPTQNVWNHIAVTFDGTTVRHYLNGSPDGTNVPAELPSPTSDSLDLFGIKPRASGWALAGKTDEFRYSTNKKEASYYETQYNNHSDPSNFATAGTPEDAAFPVEKVYAVLIM